MRTLDGALGVVWFADLPDDPRVTGLPWTEDAGSEPAWLTVRRPRLDEPPTLPSSLTDWVDLARVRDFTARHAPDLRRSREAAPPEGTWGVSLEKTYTKLADHPDRKDIEQRYAAWKASWYQWAERRRDVDPLVRLYDRLHKMHDDARNLGESFELVLGFGRLTWRSPDGARVERHLVTHRATLHLDSATGTLTAAPDGGTLGLQLEQSMLDAAQHVPQDVYDEIREALKQAADATRSEHLECLHTALESWVNAAHSAGRYERDGALQRPHTLDTPVVGFTPALVLRERTGRATLEALSGIAGRIEGGERPTELLRYLAGAEGAFTAADRRAPDGTAGEVYFALPANEEQRTIAERLRENRLVVVQGPPGTGKTHTIANLVTDLLARGKRVLITSHTPRALRVLRDKLPRDVRDLCVSRTEDGRQAQRELEASVQRILREYSGFDPRHAQSEIARFEARLATARDAQHQLLKELATLREQETRRFTADLGDYSGSLQEIAERLAAEAPSYSWIGSVPQEQPAVTAEEALRLLHTARAYTPELRSLAAEVPGPAELPSPGDFEQAVAVVRTAEEAHTAAAREPGASAYDEPVDRLTEKEQQRLDAALDVFAAARVRAAAMAAAAEPWVGEALEAVFVGQDWQVRTRHEAVTAALDTAGTALGELGPALVTGLEDDEPPAALASATTLHDGLSVGRRLRGVLGTRTKLAKAVGAFAERVRVDGRAPEDVEGAAKVLARVRLELALDQVESEWGGGGTSAWRSHGPRLARLRQDAETLDALLELGAARTEVISAAATSPELAAAPWQDRAVESAVRALLRARVTLREAERSRRLIAEAEDLLRTWTDRPGASPALALAREAVVAVDAAAYRAACGGLAEVREAARLRAAHGSALTPVQEGFPALAKRIVAAPDEPEWEERLVGLADAWAWSAWRERLERLTDPEVERACHARLAEADAEVRIMLSRLAAARAWHGSLSVLTGDQTTALKAYQQAAGRIRGKYQHRYRQAAQEALRDAQAAVPAWIMPLHQVAETVPMEHPGVFDVVIVDEASQSGLEAMLLTWLADRIVVVGDGKQVSPSHVGLRQDEYFGLQDKHLTGLDSSRKSLFGPDTSLFDLAEALAGGRGTLMLKEHFRCMPEIISFSNELAYNGDLLPLRQYGADRLPPVRTVHVPDGEAMGSSGRTVNQAEAEALVSALVACSADPSYAGRTMGVISLRSSKAHIQELENLLVARLPYEEREDRRIRVGNAEDFQGDERDIMFLSCLDSATTSAGSVRGGYSGKTYEQRINVAASRARDQVWVFHSATTEQFHENDLRRAYLDHLTRPAEEAEAVVSGEVHPDQRHEAFENLFQQRVYLELTGRGYRVRPQYQVGRHAIDLVVEGGTRRLAVECDGDKFAEGEDAATAAARQRDLERVDWTFVRLRGSRFHWDRQQAMDPVWAALDRLGIEPVPETDSSTPATVSVESAEAAVRTQPADEAEPIELIEPIESEPAEPMETPTTGAVVGSGYDAPEEAAALEPEPEPEPKGGEPAPPPLTGRRQGFPVSEVAPDCYQRVLRELHQLQRVLSRPDEDPGDVDPANLVFYRMTQRERRDRYEKRAAFLRSFLDAVSGSAETDDATVVVPGSLLTLELDGEVDDSLFTIAEMAGEGVECVSPASPLGQALMWRPQGQRVEYSAADGRVRHAVIRAIRSR
ncbi:AAA domain-containing protein [Streptomyces sp. GSL17-111]|uniref:AAA domain-containing protein n=1 Tax=Streptomyces sp. GSL17-111 TaxID=3121596 RepID=UPI0030F37F60